MRDRMKGAPRKIKQKFGTLLEKRSKGKTSRVDLQDQYLFFALFVIGAASIWILKSWGVSQFWVEALPMSLMALYALIALYTKHYRIREDRVGDNIYYLGFLYTLTSLANALYAFDAEGSGATAIITNFGIAIWTTIFGLAGRVFFNQMRVDPVEYEREARISLAQTSNELRANLGDISNEAAVFKQKLFQILEEGVTDLSEVTKASLEKNVQQFSETSGEAVENIRTAFTNFTDHAGQLNDVASKNVEALEALFGRVEKIEASPELISEKLEPVAEQFSLIASEAMRRSREKKGELKRLNDLIETAAAATETLQNTIVEMDNALTNKVEAIAETLDGNATAAKDFAKAITDITEALQSQIKANREIADNMEETKNVHALTLKEMRSTIEADLTLSKEHREAMAEMAKESRLAVKEVEQSLISLTGTLAEQLSG